MGVNDDREMLAAAQAENLRLERALTQIRDLMQPNRPAGPDAPVDREYLQSTLARIIRRTNSVRTVLAEAGYPTTLTPTESEQASELATDLEEGRVIIP